MCIRLGWHRGGQAPSNTICPHGIDTPYAMKISLAPNVLGGSNVLSSPYSSPIFHLSRLKTLKIRSHSVSASDVYRSDRTDHPSWVAMETESLGSANRGTQLTPAFSYSAVKCQVAGALIGMQGLERFRETAKCQNIPVTL